MTSGEKLRLSAPCGLDCFNCPLHEAPIRRRGSMSVRQLVAIVLVAAAPVACGGSPTSPSQHGSLRLVGSISATTIRPETLPSGRIGCNPTPFRSRFARTHGAR